MTPEGLATMGRRNLGKVVAVYLLFAGIALAVPALLASSNDSSHRHDDSSHPTHETSRR